MAKTIVKELIIILLLCLAIILVLGILLYEYVPMSKTIPNPVSYTTPEDVKQELVSTGDIDENDIILTYEVDSNDLSNYKRTQDYKPGKANPFSSYESSASNTTQGNSSTGGNSNNSQGSTNSGSGNSATDGNNSSTSGGKFFQDKGTK